MRFDLLLYTPEPHPVLPVHYQYPLSAAICRLLTAADGNYAAFLQSEGYPLPGRLKNFRLFTFSNLITPFHIRKERLVMKTNAARLTIALHLPGAAEKFIREMLVNRQLEITDRQSRMFFTIRQVERIPFLPLMISGEEKQPVSLLLRPLSPLIVGQKKEREHYDFLPPDHPSFIYQLIYDWKEKYRIAYPNESIEAVFDQVEIKYVPEMRPFRSRLMTIKAHTKEERKIRGFERFALYVSAPIRALELAGNAGLGMYNSLGMGCMEARLRPGAYRK